LIKRVEKCIFDNLCSIKDKFSVKLLFIPDSKCFQSVLSLQAGCMEGHALAEAYFGTPSASVLSFLLCSRMTPGLRNLSLDAATGLHMHFFSLPCPLECHVLPHD
jgi:hypothetical protein